MFASDFIAYVENPKESMEQLVELISVFSKVIRYKSVPFFQFSFLMLSINGWKMKCKRKAVPFTVASKIVKYFTGTL